MQDSAEIYEELIARTDELIAPLAAQVREEVARGRLVQGLKLPEAERRTRQSRLMEADLGRIGKEDMAMLPYTGDERLALLCQTLLTLTDTMTASRQTLWKFCVERGLHAKLRFIEPDESEAVDIDLDEDLERHSDVPGTVQGRLEPVQREVGEWR